MINPGLKGKALKASTEKLWLVYIVRWRWNVDTDLTLLRGFWLLSLTVYLSRDGKLLMSKQVFSRVYVILGHAHVVHVFYPLAQQRYKDEFTGSALAHHQQCFCCIFDFPVISALVIHLRQTEGFVTGRILCSLATDWPSTWHRTNEGGWQKNKTDYKQVEQMLIHSSLWHRQTLFQQQHPETDWGLNITAVGWFGVNCLSS